MSEYIFRRKRLSLYWSSSHCSGLPIFNLNLIALASPCCQGRTTLLPFPRHLWWTNRRRPVFPWPRLPRSAVWDCCRPGPAPYASTRLLASCLTSQLSENLNIWMEYYLHNLGSWSYQIDANKTLTYYQLFVINFLPSKSIHPSTIIIMHHEFKLRNLRLEFIFRFTPRLLKQLFKIINKIISSFQQFQVIF